MTLKASLFCEELLPVFRISRWSGLRRRSLRGDRRGEHRREHHGQNQSTHIAYLGCVTTSTRAGSPFMAASAARRSAGPKSLGLVIGPSPYSPMLLAIMA